MPDPFYVLRSGRVYPGDTTYFCSPTGQLPATATINPTPPPLTSTYLTVDGELTLLEPTRLADFTDTWVMGVNVSPTATTGTKTVTWLDPIDFTTVHTLSIVVATQPTATSANVALSGGRAAIQAAIDAGHSPIILDPGDYPIDIPLTLNTGTPAAIVEIDGRGMASFTRLPQAGSYYNQFISVTTNLTLNGIKFRGSGADPGHPDFVLQAYPYSPSAVDVNVIDCTFQTCALGAGYTEPDPETDVGELLIKDCEFIRASLEFPPTGTVADQCIFRESPDSGAHAFYNPVSQKWLLIGCDWVRTARGILLASEEPAAPCNGVAAACRFFDVAFGAPNAGEVISFEKDDGGSTHIENNAFVWCQMYNCSGPGIILWGGGINNNFFRFIMAHAMSASIWLNGFADNIAGNQFEHIEMGAGLRLDNECSSNFFNWVVALRTPLSAGNQPVWVGDGVVFPNYYNADFQGRLPFADASTHEEDSPNEYHNIYISYPEGVVQVTQFPKVPKSNESHP